MIGPRALTHLRGDVAQCAKLARKHKSFQSRPADALRRRQGCAAPVAQARHTAAAAGSTPRSSFTRSATESSAPRRNAPSARGALSASPWAKRELHTAFVGESAAPAASRLGRLRRNGSRAASTNATASFRHRPHWAGMAASRNHPHAAGRNRFPRPQSDELSGRSRPPEFAEGNDGSTSQPLPRRRNHRAVSPRRQSDRCAWRGHRIQAVAIIGERCCAGLAGRMSIERRGLQANIGSDAGRKCRIASRWQRRPLAGVRLDLDRRSGVAARRA